jgi:hypothetical protein
VFGRHRDFGPLATARDLVEIVAILAAGIWAIYVFAYEQRIKPAGEPPSILLFGSLHQLGAHDGLVQVGFKGDIRNTGHNDVAIVALGFVVNGLRYTTKGTPLENRVSAGLNLYQRDARIGSRTLVYREVELTRFVDKRYGGGFTLSPQGEVPYSGIFLVRSGEFDAIALYGSVAFTKIGIDGGYPTRITYTPNGAISFASQNDDPNYDSLEVTLDQIALW